MQPETQKHRFRLLDNDVTAATIAYAAALLTATQATHYVGNRVMREHLKQMNLRRESAVAALDAFCATDDITQP